MKHSITLIVNDDEYNLEVNSNETLLSVLRNRLHLTGVKEGCGVGECGACVVIIDGVIVNSCLTLAVEVDGSRILTIEGISKANQLNEIQQSFIDNGAIQCGFCTPGFILAVKSLLDRNSSPTDKDIEEAFSGHLCRCTGYEAIKRATKAVIK